MQDDRRRLHVITRREFMIGTSALAGASVLALAGCDGGTGPGASSPSDAPSRWIRVSTAGLSAGTPSWTELDVAPDASGTTPDSSVRARAGAWLALQADGSVAAFVPACTHQRCLYDWDVASARFACRCHEGFFALDGTVLGGPPPRPLDRYATRPAGPDAIEIGWAAGT
jgi:Rieske Fe-S protein